MARRRILYIATVLGAVAFYWAYQKWMAWLFLLAVLSLPVVSLVLSLPALFSLRICMSCPSVVQRGSKVYAQVENKSWIPAPAYEYKITAYKPLTQSSSYIKSTEPIPTQHCGTLLCRIEKVEVSDYLGLFRFRLSTPAAGEITVRPDPVIATQLPQLQQRFVVAWKPKPGGGFAENHEMRLYRPGDSLNQIHWKLSAKTKQLVIREPMVPLGHQTVVGLCLFGTEEELDFKFSRLWGVCSHLLQSGLPFELQVICKDGIQKYPISTEETLIETVDLLLGMEPAPCEQELTQTTARAYWIGGVADER